MGRYSQERKANVMKKMLPPANMTVADLARQEGISSATLYNWRDQLKQEGHPVPGNKTSTEQWSAEAKLSTIIVTASMSAAELSQYCREKGLHVEQIQRWKQDCLGGFELAGEQEKNQQKRSKADKAKIKKLERELHRKDKALAETTALLVLRKKLNALWGEDQEGN